MKNTKHTRSFTRITDDGGEEEVLLCVAVAVDKRGDLTNRRDGI